MRRVVVTGMGMVTPLGDGVDANWRKLMAAESGIRGIQAFDTSDLATKIARQDASSAKPRDARKHFDFEKTLNAETDETILPIARAIRSQRSSPMGITQ